MFMIGNATNTMCYLHYIWYTIMIDRIQQYENEYTQQDLKQKPKSEA